MSNEQVPTLADAVKIGTTTFVTDSVIQEQDFNQNQYKSMINPIEDQTIPDFLAKPYAIYSGTWNTSQTLNTQLYSTGVATFLTSVTQWNKKIQGFNLVRGTACFRVVLNANPFQQGKLISSFVPAGANMVMRNLDLCQKTQQPNVELDCRDATSLIKIPYIATTEWYDMDRGFADWGVYTLSVLSPLSVGSGGENNVNYTVFLYFEDFELAAPLIAQAGEVGLKRTPRPNRVVESHAEREASGMTQTGSISKGLQLGADVASAVASIPMLAPLAEPAGWILRGASKIAAWFGWSKPQLDQPPQLSARRLITNMPNSTGVSSATTLALFHDNKIEIMPDMAGNGMDEMSFDYLKGRKALIRSTGWATSNAPGDTLYSTEINPRTLKALNSSFISGTTTYALQSAPAFSYLSEYFLFWRGSVDVLIKFAKTDFHSGRLLITFTPTANPGYPTPTIQSSIQSLREVVDIRGKSEVLLKLPFLLGEQYIRNDQISGLLKVQVLNELRCPETCSQGVDFLIYVSAGADFELQVPGHIDDFAGTPFVPQGGAAVPDVQQTIVDEPIGGYTIPPMSLEPSRLCVGECFASIKQLISRYTPLQTATPIINGATGNFGIYPFYFGLPSNTGASGSPGIPAYHSDMMSCFAGGYAFFRGSVRLIDYCADYVYSSPIARLDVRSQLGGSVINGGLANEWGNTVNPYSGTRKQDCPAIQISDAGIGQQEVRVPYYCQTHMSEVALTTQTTPESQTDPNAVVYLGSYNGNPTEPHLLYRSASDEFQFAYFLGFPPRYSSSVTT